MKWRVDEPPDQEELLVSIHDDSGDLPFDYTTSGWYFKGNWIVDNQICYHVAAWAFMPPPCVSKCNNVRAVEYGEFADAILDVFKHTEKYKDVIDSILPNDTEAGFNTGLVYAFTLFTKLSVPAHLREE